MKLLSLVSTLALASTVSASTPTYSATVLIDRATMICTLISPPAETQHHRAIKTSADVVEQTRLRQNRLPEELLVQEPYDMQQFLTVLGGSVEAVTARVTERCTNGVRADPEAEETKAVRLRGTTSRSLADEAEIRKLVDSGDPLNRIDVVLMGDGYTATEKTKFYSDMQRLTNEMFTGDTFAQYLPLFNIWTAYVPSVESGIGVGGKARNTAFKLYRDGTELRAVYTGNTAGARTVCKAVGTGACDFPSLIGNDDFYGGLGGEFVISTRSVTSGTVVMRHEMGHNFGDVGEEYDGGQIYSGANNVRTVAGVTWKHWLTDATRLKEEKMAQLYQKHIWYDLKQGAYTIKFSSTGTFKRWYILFSVSGTDTDDSLTVTLDGQPMPWKSNKLKDRTFYSWTNSTGGFSSGSHTLVFKAGGSFDGAIIKQLCSAVIYEYADEKDFKLDDPDYVGIYPTYDINKVKSYRPDNERCLMRNMTSPYFCRVCQENMWLKFMERIEFIDSVVVSGRKVSLKPIPLGQLRLPSDQFVKSNPAVASAERYTVRWLRGTTELTALRDSFEVDLSKEPAGSYSVNVTFSTPNVRKDPSGYMSSVKTFTIA